MLETLLEHPLTLRVGWTLVHTLWQGALLAGLLGLALGSVGEHRSRARHALAHLTLLIWLAAPLMTFVLLGGPDPVAAPASGSPTVVVSGTTTGTAIPEPAGSGDDGAVPGGSVFPAPIALVAAPALHGLVPYAALVWSLTAALLSLRLLGGLLTVHDLGRRGEPLAHLEAQVRELGARLGLARRVRLLVSAGVDAPTALGWLGPVILLPAGALTGLDARQLELVLAHELAHIKRNDFLVNVIQGVVEALLFYHPLTWWLSRTLRTEREHVCDDLALHATGAAPVQLAETLARLEAGRPAPAPTLAATGNLTSRVRRLLQTAPPRPARAPTLLPLVTLVSLGLWFTLAAGQAASAEALFERHQGGQFTGPYFEAPEAGWPTYPSPTALIDEANYPLRAPTVLPTGYRFDNAVWVPSARTATMTYGAGGDPFPHTRYLTFMQTPAEQFAPVPIGAEATVERVIVGVADGAYVRGRWAHDEHGRNPSWEQGAGLLLAWQADGMVYVLGTDWIVDSGPEVPSLEELLATAASLVVLEPTPGTPSSRQPLPATTTRQWATLVGDATFTPDYDALTGLAAGSSLTIEERSPATARRVIVTPNASGGLEFHYSEDGTSTPFGDEARAWYEGLLDELVLKRLAERSGDSEGFLFGSMTLLPDRYQSFVSLGDRRTAYPLDLRVHSRPQMTQETTGNVERTTHAAAHGLISQGALELALSHYMSAPDLSTQDLEALRFAIDHLASDAARQRMAERLDERLAGLP